MGAVTDVLFPLLLMIVLNAILKALWSVKHPTAKRVEGENANGKEDNSEQKADSGSEDEPISDDDSG